MGLRMRKSINLGGGFRINISKNGVGYSWGVPGYRITQTASGKIRRTYSIPGTGISYIEEIGEKKNGRKANSSMEHSYIQEPVMEDIVSASIENYRPAKYEDFIKSVEKILVANMVSTWLCISIIFAVFPVFLITGILGIALKIYVITKGKLDLEYEMDDYHIEKHKKLVNAWIELSRCSQLLQIIQTGKVQNRKIHAGASELVNSLPFKLITEPPFYIKTNVDIIQLKLSKETLIFLPDKVLIIQGSKVGSIDYSDISIKVDNIPFIVDVAPKDTIVINYTWEKVNKDGSPDKRYKLNRMLPICKYGKIEITSSSGLNILLYCSNPSCIDKFKEL